MSWSQVNYQNERFDMFFTEAAQDHPDMLECETQQDKADDQDQHDIEETDKADFGTCPIDLDAEENADHEDGIELQDPELGDRRRRKLPLQDRFTLKRLLMRAHEGLGHPHLDRFLRILRYAKASPEVLEEARKLQCSVCIQETKPSRRAAPPRELGVNEIVGVDVVYLPMFGGGNKKRAARNVIDWGTKFQMVLPMDSKKPDEARRAYRQWLRFFGPPKTVMVDLGREFKGNFALRAGQDGSCVEPSAVEAPYQRAITERHGKTIKFMLQKAMDEYSCQTMRDWEDLLDVTCMMKNRLMMQKWLFTSSAGHRLHAPNPWWFDDRRPG